MKIQIVLKKLCEKMTKSGNFVVKLKNILFWVKNLNIVKEINF